MKLNSEATQALKDAVLAERRADAALAESQVRMDEVLEQLRREGVPFGHIARCTFQARRGRAPTLRERKRETTRIRLRVWRVTHGNFDPAACAGKVPLAKVPLQVEELNNMTNDPRLIKRTTIEETFAAPDEDALAGPGSGNEDGDDLDDDEDDDDSSDEA